jgi:hypothetical protein
MGEQHRRAILLASQHHVVTPNRRGRHARPTIPHALTRDLTLLKLPQPGVSLDVFALLHSDAHRLPAAPSAAQSAGRAHDGAQGSDDCGSRWRWAQDYGPIDAVDREPEDGGPGVQGHGIVDTLPAVTKRKVPADLAAVGVWRGEDQRAAVSGPGDSGQPHSRTVNFGDESIGQCGNAALVTPGARRTVARGDDVHVHEPWRGGRPDPDHCLAARHSRWRAPARDVAPFAIATPGASERCRRSGVVGTALGADRAGQTRSVHLWHAPRADRTHDAHFPAQGQRVRRGRHHRHRVAGTGCPAPSRPRAAARRRNQPDSTDRDGSSKSAAHSHRRSVTPNSADVEPIISRAMTKARVDMAARQGYGGACEETDSPSSAQRLGLVLGGGPAGKAILRPSFTFERPGRPRGSRESAQPTRGENPSALTRKLGGVRPGARRRSGRRTPAHQRPV